MALLLRTYMVHFFFKQLQLTIKKKKIFPSTVWTFYLRAGQPTTITYCETFNRQSFFFLFFGRHSFLFHSHRKMIFRIRVTFLYYNVDRRMGRTHGKLRNIRFHVIISHKTQASSPTVQHLWLHIYYINTIIVVIIHGHVDVLKRIENRPSRW